MFGLFGVNTDTVMVMTMTIAGQWLLFDDETVTPVATEDVRLLVGTGGGMWQR
jgi:hypothetical protein